MRIPQSCAIRARRGAFRLAWSHPMRIFSVTGTLTARTVASRIAAAAASSRINADPACWPSATFFTGQPKLMSIMSAPRSTASRAASAMAVGSQPASCRALIPPQPSTSAIAMVLRFSRIIAQEAIISDTTMPPPSCLASRRNGRSVTPDIGARITGVSIRTPPPRSIAGRSNVVSVVRNDSCPSIGQITATPASVQCGNRPPA